MQNIIKCKTLICFKDINIYFDFSPQIKCKYCFSDKSGSLKTMLYQPLRIQRVKESKPSLYYSRGCLKRGT